jgi:hypothetical protein
MGVVAGVPLTMLALEAPVGSSFPRGDAELQATSAAADSATAVPAVRTLYFFIASSLRGSARARERGRYVHADSRKVTRNDDDAEDSGGEEGSNRARADMQERKAGPAA